MSAFLSRLRPADRQLVTNIAMAVFRNCGFTQFDIEAAYTCDSPSRSRMAGPVEEQMAKYRNKAAILRCIAFSDLDFRVDLKEGSLRTGDLIFRVATQVILRAIIEIVNVNPAFGEEDSGSWMFLGRMPRDMQALPVATSELPQDNGPRFVDLWADHEGWNFIIRYGRDPRSFVSFCIDDLPHNGAHRREALRRNRLARVPD